MRENQRSKLRVADEDKPARTRRKRGGGGTDAHVKPAAKDGHPRRNGGAPRSRKATPSSKRASANGRPPGGGRPAAKGRPANGRPASGDVREAMMVRRYAETRDPRLKEELAERFMPLARSLAMRYRGGSESLEDLVQVACLGLVKALDGYDPARGRSFTGYAVPTMLGELRRHFRDRVWNVHLPRGLQERSMDVSGAIDRLSDQLGRSPTVAQIAVKLELSEEDVLEAMQADEARRTLSLDAPRARGDEESTPTVETVGREEMGYDAVDSQLAAADADLDERERLVLRLRFGRNLNQYEIGRRLGVSQMQISRIMRRALRKLLEAVQVDAADVRREVERLARDRTAA